MARRASTTGIANGTRSPSSEQAAKKARQGVAYPVLEALDVRDPETMRPVPRDGETLGEVMFRGNVVMKGYLKNKTATDGGVRRRLVSFRRPRRHPSRRLHPAQGPLQGHHHFRRRKHFLDRGRGRALQASGGAGRRRGGEARRKMGRDAVRVRRAKARRRRRRAEELIAWCKKHLAAYKCPRHVVFAEIPKTVTGKLQKFKLRESGEGGVTAVPPHAREANRPNPPARRIRATGEQDWPY